jgi:hypothetical protein
MIRRGKPIRDLVLYQRWFAETLLVAEGQPSELAAEMFPPHSHRTRSDGRSHRLARAHARAVNVGGDPVAT